MKQKQTKLKKMLVKAGETTGMAGSVLVVLLFVAYFLLLENTAPKEPAYQEYQYHIAMITEGIDNSFSQDVYAGASEAGKRYGAYVEQIGAGVLNEFSVEDAINVAIYTDVDGILLRPTAGEFNEKMVDKAIAQGIPVITMQKDLPSSNRQAFVGINDYFLGQQYGKRVLELLEYPAGLVTVLFPRSTFDEKSQSWFEQGLENTVQSANVKFEFHIIQDDQGLSNAEDVYHEIMASAQNRPDIVLCLDETITRSTSQLVEENGLSNQVKIIGSYASAEILQKIEAGYLDSVITVDPYAMGCASIEALMIYQQYGMVSYYTEADTVLIDQTTVNTYRMEEEDETSITAKR